jgi:hypothetical protein
MPDLGFDCACRIAGGDAATTRTLAGPPGLCRRVCNILGWSSSISASNNNNWAADVAHGIAGTIDGDRLSARNIQNFSWRTETDYAERWEQRTYDISKLPSLDLFLVYWTGPSRPALSPRHSVLPRFVQKQRFSRLGPFGDRVFVMIGICLRIVNQSATCY